ncbi:hypothetical protein M422DRAFT_783208 [Sphaerobolus stellatus SS14]|uniref:Uncharacterized protein n=1 Tax=Sphaerobolus stellatus (strain SS14) TaxID=990650 RepID=A0A0C9UEF6_SPHS4|nr:hypothetical protein M422DRAFT_783208 [Sphaerobolus stellatus SS14]
MDSDQFTAEHYPILGPAKWGAENNEEDLDGSSGPEWQPPERAQQDSNGLDSECQLSEKAKEKRPERLAQFENEDFFPKENKRDSDSNESGSEYRPSGKPRQSKSKGKRSRRSKSGINRPASPEKVAQSNSMKQVNAAQMKTRSAPTQAFSTKNGKQEAPQVDVDKTAETKDIERIVAEWMTKAATKRGASTGIGNWQKARSFATH